MPLYEYLCESCGRTLEAIQSYSEPPLTMCDRCGGALKKLLSAPAVQFKGTGWYVSDYGKGGSGARKHEAGEGSASSGESKDSASESKAESKSEAKAETKPDAKPESKADSKPSAATDSKPAPKKSDAA
jgi:putative FmdB family regulatory protein